MPTREQLESALLNAHKAGDVPAARALANAIKGGQFDQPKPEPAAFEISMDQPAGGAAPSMATPEMQAQRGGIANPLARGATFGFEDEIVGAVGSLVGNVLPESMGGLPERETLRSAYEGIRNQVNEDRLAFEESHPKAAMAAEAAGGLMTGGLGVAKGVAALAPKGAKMASKAATGALIGGVEGGLYGAGTAEEGERAEAALRGAVGGAVVGGAGAAGLQALTQTLAKRALQTRQIQSGSSSKELAGVKLDAAGRLKSDTLAKEAMRQGFSDGFVQQVKTASIADKRKILKMVRVAKRALRDNRFAATNRINQVVGDSLVHRVNTLNRFNRAAANKLDHVAQSLKGQGVDYAPAVTKFMDDLQALDIKINRKGSVKVSTQGSMIEGAKDAEAALSRILKRMINTKTPDAFDVHRLKRFIDNQVTYGKGQDKGLKGEVLRAVKQLRHNLDEALDTQFPEYNKVNTQYAETRGALDMLQEAWGRKVNMFNDSANRQLGIQSRKLLSNYAAGTNQLDAITNAELIVKKYGGKVDDNIMDLVAAESALRGLIPQKLFNTFQGDIEKAAGNVANMATGDRLGAAVDIAKSGIDKIRGIDDAGALSALEKLLQESL